jgi:hypothetical protein
MKLEIDLALILEDKLVVDTVTVLEHLVQAWENTDADAMISALQTALYLAQVSEADGETVRTSRRTHNINWNATPERRFLKCVLGVLIRKGLPKSELLAKFKALVPAYQDFFDTPVSDNAIYGRADTGRRGGKYRNENPDVHPLTRPYWPIALRAVADDQPLTANDVRNIANLGKLVGDEQEEAGDQPAQDEPAQDEAAQDEAAQDEPASDSEDGVPATGHRSGWCGLDVI